MDSFSSLSARQKLPGGFRRGDRLLPSDAVVDFN
jgi:hypothetical protein